jgi:hypothetical protein
VLEDDLGAGGEERGRLLARARLARDRRNARVCVEQVDRGVALTRVGGRSGRLVLDEFSYICSYQQIYM